jgi:hypothetical protein
MTTLNKKEAATVLAALRILQGQQEIYRHMDHFDGVLPLTNDEINALCERINFSSRPDTTTKVQVTWLPSDIQEVRPNWSLEKCEKWLDENRKSIHDRSVELGWEVIETLL